MPSWIDQFKVGDEVEFEMAGKPRTDLYSGPHPRWDKHRDYQPSGDMRVGVVVPSSIPGALCVRCDAITKDWYFYDPGSDIRPGYAAARKPVAPAVVVKPLYSVPLPTCFPKESIPPSVMASLVDQGERAVRRVLREWPYGKELKYRTTNNTLEWYFQ
jgi:hypothetical protein